MAINNSILTQTWDGQPKSTIEDGLKALLTAILAVVESPVIAENSVGRDQLTQALRDAIDSISSKVPNNRKVNNKPLTADVTIGAGDIQVDGQSLAALLDDMDTRIQQASQGEGYDDDELWEAVNSLTTTLNTLIGSGNVQGAINTFNEVVAFLNGINSSDTLAAKLALKANDADVVKSVSVNNGTPAQPDSNGNVNIEVQTGSTISPATAAPLEDGTAAVGSSAKYAREDHVHPHDSTKANASDVYSKTQTDTLLAGKQNTLTFDNAPTSGSNNPVKSGGVYTALAGKQNKLTFDSTPTASSTKPVTSGGIKTYVDGKATITGITTSQDGTFTIALSDGNSYTVNLNHVHPQYLKYELLADEAAYTALATKDSSTLYLIPES